MPTARPIEGQARLRTDYRTLSVVFFVHGLLFASWTAHIPHVKAHLELSNGTLGLVLLATPVGSISAMVITAWLQPRVGARRMTATSLVGYCVVGPFVGIATSEVGLFGALLCWGGFQGALDVSMNTQAVAQERAAGRPLMSGLHARWSLGALAGAGAGALGVGLGQSLTAQLAVLGAASLLLVPLALRLGGDVSKEVTAKVAPTGVKAAEHFHRRRWPKAVLLLAAVAFASMLCEGAAADWSAVYLRDSLGSVAVVASLGYACFAAAMVLVRLVGDRLILRYRAAGVLPVLTGIATVGFAAGLLTSNVVIALIGLAALGGGVAAVVPTVFGAAGALPGIPSAAGIAAVSACGWAGFVCGPPLIGQLASATSLPVALAVVPLLTAFISLATRRGVGTRPALILESLVPHS